MRNLRRNPENPTPSLTLSFSSNGGFRIFEREKSFWDFDFSYWVFGF